MTEVLLVEGDAARADELAAWLRSSGHRVRRSDAPGDLLAAAEQSFPQLIAIPSGPDVDAQLHELVHGDALGIPICVVGEASSTEQLAAWLGLPGVEQSPDPSQGAAASARLEGICRRAATLAASRDRAARAEATLGLVSRWTADQGLEGRLRALSATLAGMDGVIAWELALSEGPSLSRVGGEWPERRPDGWPQELASDPGLPGTQRLLAALESDRAVAVAPDLSDAAQMALHRSGDEVLVPVVAGASRYGVLRLVSASGPRPLEEDRLRQFTELGRAFGLSLRAHESTLEQGAHEGRLEAAFVARLQELERTKLRLQSALRMKSDFVALCAHDLKGPLTVVLGQAQLLKMGVLGKAPEKFEKSLAAMLKNARQMSDHINELLQRAHEEDSLSVRREDIDLVQLLRNAVEDSLGVAATRQVGLGLAGAPPEMFHLADPMLLKGVFMALLDNAIRYSPEGGEVICSLVPPSQEGSEVLVVFEDRGPGVPESELDSLYDRFRSGFAGSRHGPPPQHGLWLAWEVVRQHGGRVRYEPRAGGGSRFVVSLPVPLMKPSGSRRSGRASVVLFQPQEDLRRDALGSLSRRFEVTAVGTEDALLERLAAERPDALVVGIGAKEASSGLATLDRLAQSPQHSTIPLVLHSAAPQSTIEARASSFPNWTFTALPAYRRGLVRAVESVLEGRSGPPLSHSAFCARLDRFLRSPAAGAPAISVLRIRLGTEAPRDAISQVARWLEPRTRSADRLCEMPGGVLLLQLPGAPSGVAARIARGLKDTVGEQGAFLGEGAEVSWTSVEDGRGLDAAAVLARLKHAHSSEHLPAV